MRGKVRSRSLWGCWVRITPAYAGKSNRHSLTGLYLQDHPRLCGEKLLISVLRIQRVGSPPPMRGKGQFLIVGVRAVGITPAYAGKSRKHTA